MIITPINSRNLNSRSVIVPGTATISLGLLRSGDDVLLSMDSIRWMRMALGDKVRVVQSNDPFPVVTRSPDSYADWLYNIHKHIQPEGGIGGKGGGEAKE